MRIRTRRSLALLLSAAMVAASMQSAAYAGVISTEQLIGAIDREATIARIDAVLAREEVRGQLEQLGVNSVQASERVAALTDQELQMLAEDLESLPAGGSALAVVGVVFIVILILELVGVIDIFSKL
jgi:uncharacterized protein DUF6627